MKRGSKELSERLKAKHGAQADFVRRFNDGLPKGVKPIDAPMVTRWCCGHPLPSREHMARIEDIEGIPMRAWAEELKKGAA